MSQLTRSPAWMALKKHKPVISKHSMRSMFAADPKRFEKFSIQVESLLLDYSKNILDEQTRTLLTDLAHQSQLSHWIERMFSGEKINQTEHRAVLHTALRAPAGSSVWLDARDVMPDVLRVREQMRRYTEGVRNGKVRGHTDKAFTDIVNIGVGGSSLGPYMACEALHPYGSPKLNAHFVSNIDAVDITEKLDILDAETTLFLVSSKTFTTQETITNAHAARAWLVQRLGEEAVGKHFVALSTNLPATAQFGIPDDRVFEFWDWVGGRYSIWSAIGLPIALHIGMDAFEQMLAGGHAMDRHFRDAPFEHNMPVMMALIDIWYTNFFDACSHAILPYDHCLRRFPAYLQQLTMESNGKNVDRDLQPVDYATNRVIWGEAGTNGQHSFYQLIHQGTRAVTADFLAPIMSHVPFGEHHAMLLANCFAQTEALMLGKTADEARAELVAQGLDEAAIAELLPYKVFSGNRPSNTLLFDKLDPYTLGMLIALYEHKVYVQSVVWNINAFDQWGVEYGKQLANRLIPELHSARPIHDHDGSTNALINHYLARTRQSRAS
ncbi:MAG TPA: glucose-6-phosphate isomerase [Gallionellaceae bacterium]